MANAMDPNSAQSTPVSNPSDSSTVSGPDSPTPIAKGPVSGPGGGGKETEVAFGGLGSFEIPELSEIGKDIELPKEVEKAGVQVTPTQVVIPQALKQAGVTVVGQSGPAPVPVGQQAMPITDDQIVQGLNQKPTTSIRWLAEWCVRKLKQMRIHLRRVAGGVSRESK